jgi:4-hydroxybenzoate polyprenyltransferase
VAVNLPLVVWIASTSTPGAALALAGIYVVAWAYSAPPLRLKSRPGWDSVANAAYVLPFVFACLDLGVPAPPWREIAAFAVWSIGAHALTAVQDVEADRSAGVRTVAIALGPRGSGTLAVAAFAVAAAMVAATHQEIAVVLAVYAGVALWTAGASHPDTAHRGYRVFMFLNVLVGFVVVTRVALAHPAATWWAAVGMLLLCAVTAGGVGLARRAA